MVGLMKRTNNLYSKICDIDNIIYIYIIKLKLIIK